MLKWLEQICQRDCTKRTGWESDQALRHCHLIILMLLCQLKMVSFLQTTAAGPTFSRVQHAWSQVYCLSLRQPLSLQTSCSCQDSKHFCRSYCSLEMVLVSRFLNAQLVHLLSFYHVFQYLQFLHLQYHSPFLLHLQLECSSTEQAVHFLLSYLFDLKICQSRTRNLVYEDTYTQIHNSRLPSH